MATAMSAGRATMSQLTKSIAELTAQLTAKDNKIKPLKNCPRNNNSNNNNNTSHNSNNNDRHQPTWRSHNASPMPDRGGYCWTQPDRLRLGLQRLRLEALESLQNLRAFEYTGSTLSQGRTFVLGPTPSLDDWATAHRSTLENLLWVIIEYYRRLHGDTVLKVDLLQIMELDLPELPVHPDRFSFEDTHEWTGPSHTAFHLDIRALEMLSVDQLVNQIYEDRLIKQDIQGFVT
jgi:hypothetical protein